MVAKELGSADILRAKEIQKLAEVVYEPGDLHPFGLSVSPDGLGSLEEVLDLREFGLKDRLPRKSVRCSRESSHTSGSESSTNVLSFSIASQIPA
jgi:hypothetical protein